MNKNNHFVIVTLLFFLFVASGSVQANINEDLFYAARGGHYRAVVQLIDKGANVNYANRQRETPMHGAASKGHVRVMQLLRSRGAQHAMRTSGGWVPLHHAVRFGHISAATYLLNLGTPLYLRTRDGKTVFDIAKATRNRAMIQFLDNYRRRRR